MSDDANTDFMSNREEEIAKLIRTRSQFFSNVTVITCSAGETNKKIAEALAQLGLFVVVEIKARGKLPVVDDGQPWPVFITITETPVTNRGSGKFATGKTIRSAIEEMARLVDEVLGIGEATIEDVADPSREIVRISGQVRVQISKKQ